MGLSIALRISKITKSKGPNFAQFWSKPYEAVWDRWKTAQRFREKYFCLIFVKNVVVLGEKHDAHDWQSWNFAQRPIRHCSSRDFFVSCPLQGANISQISSFTKTTEPHEIQLVPNIWSTSFHQPVKISIDSFAAVASFQLVTKYISKVKVLSKYFILKQLFPCKMGAKEQIS